MRTIELECPSCQEVLELDAGFAGGVCRCSKCGTLMTVPSGKGQAETLSKPSPDPAYADKGDFDDDGDDLSSLSAAASTSNRGSVEPGEYRTASGKVVKLDRSARVPTAGARKKARIATTIVFFGIVLVGVIAGVIAILLIMNSGSRTAGGKDGQQQAIAYEASANPYELTFLNLAGLPLEGSVAVVVEASANSEDWAIDFADMAVKGLSQTRGEASVGFFAASADPYDSIAPTSAGQLSAGDIAQWFTDLPREGTPDYAEAVTSAVDMAPDMLILVISEISEDDLAGLDTLLAEQKRLAVHAVLIDSSGVEGMVRDWLAERGGTGEVVPYESSSFLYLKDLAEDN